MTITNTPATFDFGTVKRTGVVPSGLTAFTVTNNGEEAVDITIKGVDVGRWTLSDTATPGASVFGLKAGVNTLSKTITSVTSLAVYDYVLTESHQRKIVYSNGLFWLFYTDGTNTVYRTSATGATWSAATTISAITEGMYFNVWLDNGYLTYVDAEGGGSYPHYRLGFLENNGTITWSAVMQELSDHDDEDDIPFGSVDSNGYPWISYEGLTDQCPYITKSSTKDGTWTTASGFPYKLSTDTHGIWATTVLPLSGGKIYVLYTYREMSSGKILGKIYNAGWGDEETITTTKLYSYAYQYNAVVDGNDDIHLAFITEDENDDLNIYYTKRDHNTGTWSTETSIMLLPLTHILNNSYPHLSIDDNSGVIYCFWDNSPTDNHIYFKRLIGGVWDAAATDLVTDTYHIEKGYKFTTSYSSNGTAIGLAWLALDGVTAYLRFYPLGTNYNVVVKKTAPFNNLTTSLAGSASVDWGLELLAPTSYIAPFASYKPSTTVNGTVTLEITGDSEVVTIEAKATA